MTYTSVKYTGALICFSLSVIFSQSIIAAQEQSTNSTKEVWLAQQVNKHPDIVSARETMNAIFSMAQGNKQPLYNPDLQTGYEREGDANNFTIGLNQRLIGGINEKPEHK